MYDIDWSDIHDDEELRSAMKGVLDELGMSAGAFSYSPISILPGGQPGVIHYGLGVNLDEELVQNWYQFNKQQHSINQKFDPVRRIMSQRLLPQRIRMADLLDDRKATRNVAAANWVRTLMEAGVRETFHVPVFTSRCEYWTFAGLRFFDNPREDDLSESEYAYLAWAAKRLVWTCIDRLHWREAAFDAQDVPITPREQDCLFWTAQGQTAEDIAALLDVSTETVRKHLKNVSRKLDARNKTHAVVLAHRLGILPLN
jgi:DNA-binding CsgD family transcriptional regulator